MNVGRVAGIEVEDCFTSETRKLSSQYRSGSTHQTGDRCMAQILQDEQFKIIEKKFTDPFHLFTNRNV